MPTKRKAARKKSAPTKRRATERKRQARRAPKATSKRGAKRRIFRGAARVWHLVDPATFVASTDRQGFEHLSPPKGARTSCCNQPIDSVYAVTTSRAGPGPGITNWCPGVPA